MKKRILSALLLLSLLFSLAACQPAHPASTGSSGTPSAESTDSAPASSADAVSAGTTDRSGAEITLPAEVKTIVSMAPSTTQVLAELGLTDTLVGIDTTSEPYAPGIRADAVKLDMMAPDLEQLVALKPDLIFTSSISAAGGDDPFKPVRDAGICIVSIPTSNTIEDVKKDVQFIADCVGKSGEGKQLVDTMQAELDKMSAIGKTITEQKTVLFEIAAAPAIYSFGKGVFLNEALELIGARNVLADQESWIPVAEEAAVGANPDVIFTNVTYIENPVDEIKGRAGWANVTAVKDGQVFYIDNGASSLPNHHIADAMKQMALALYPAQYASLQ